MYTRRLEPKGKKQINYLEKGSEFTQTRGERSIMVRGQPFKLILLYDYNWDKILCRTGTTMHTFALNITPEKPAKNIFFQGLSRHEGRTAEAAPGRLGRGEHGKARPGNSVPKNTIKLVLSRGRLKTWS